MRHSSNSRVVDILHERESELFLIRSSFDELQSKFSQLEEAFKINLRVQRRLESELELCKCDKTPEKSVTNSVDEEEKKSVTTRAEFHSQLTKIRMKKEHWKAACIYQTKITDKQKLEYKQSIKSIRNECEKILKTCRESSEDYFRELLELYKNSNEKVIKLEEAVDASQASARLTRDRILELANLLQTLEKFRSARIEVVCQRAAKALRSSACDEDKSYEADIKHLRAATCTHEENYESPELLQAQNSVLRQVVKHLKEKLRAKLNELPGSAKNIDETRNNIFESSLGEAEGNDKNEKSQELSGENTTVSYHEKVEQVDDKTEKWSKEEEGKEEVTACRENKQNEDCTKSSVSARISGARSSLPKEITTNSEESHRKSKQSESRDQTFERIYVDSFESHKNGIPYIEYTYNFLNRRQFRVKHSRALSAQSPTMTIEFVDSEQAYESASLDRTIFYLGDNVEVFANLKESGIHCGVQTKHIVTREKCIQTTITGANGFCRVNTGAEVLNSEKRAIERSLVNLESTVATLKAKALGQARSMIETDVKVLGDEFFNCFKRLER